MVFESNETGLAGNGVGVGRGTSVGVGEAANKNGVGMRMVTSSGIEVGTTTVGVAGATSF
jgi:hypothetical protein